MRQTLFLRTALLHRRAAVDALRYLALILLRKLQAMSCVALDVWGRQGRYPLRHRIAAMVLWQSTDRVYRSVTLAFGGLRPLRPRPRSCASGGPHCSGLDLLVP